MTERRRKDPGRFLRGEKTATPVRYRALFFLLAIFISVVGVYAVIFQIIMTREGQVHSWWSSFYWAVVTMSTLGYGDITFNSDLGRLFSIIVIISGIAFLLVLLPFVLIQFIVVPILERRATARAPRAIDEGIEDHLVLTNTGSIEDALIRRAEDSGMQYVLIVGDLEEALRLHDAGYKVVVGELDNPDTYRAARVPQASLFAATRGDIANTNIIFTVREVSEKVPVVALASASASVDILELAGANQVIQLGVTLGKMMAQRIVGTEARCQIVGELAGLSVAEVGISGTNLVNKTLSETKIRTLTGVNVVGVFNRGEFVAATLVTKLEPNSALILAGTKEQLKKYDEVFAEEKIEKSFVLIIGGGRVGRQIGQSLNEMGIKFKIIEKQSDRVRDPNQYVVGDAADLRVLEAAGIKEASSILVTTHEDDVNVYLTIYARRLRPEAQIISRARLDRNVTTLYKAGADAVLSYASTGATAIWNRGQSEDTILLADGLLILRVKVPEKLAGITLQEADLQNQVGVTAIALVYGGVTESDPDPLVPLAAGAELIIIGDDLAHEKFRDIYPD